MSRKNGRRALLVVGRLQVGPPITLCVLQRPLAREELFVKNNTWGKFEEMLYLKCTLKQTSSFENLPKESA